MESNASRRLRPLSRGNYSVSTEAPSLRASARPRSLIGESLRERPEVVDNSTILFNFSNENSTYWPSMQPRSLIARRKQRLPLNGGFAYWFSLLSRVLGQHTLLYVEREFELNLAEYRVLTVLEDRDKPSIRDIAAYTQMDKAQVTRALAALMARGLITQIVDRVDRRLRVVDMTSAGRAILANSLPFMAARQRRLERCLSAAELRVLWNALSALSNEANHMLAEEQSAVKGG
jgi:DNA-binding MarR family transcriptional regulator